MLWVIMPAFDEEAAVGSVLEEWLPALRALETPFRLLAVDDGSRDRTLQVLELAARANPEVIVCEKANTGHGQSCVVGYRLALDAGAEWIFQIDSDGQCDPRFLGDLWRARQQHPVVFGLRVRRDDGWMRSAISRAVSLVVWLGVGTWVADANVPYRLMRRDVLAAVVGDVPPDFRLANVLVSVRLKQQVGIHWIPIHFRARIGGAPSVGIPGFLVQGARLYRQLRRERWRARRG